jgi:dihydroorotase-like cyclic amidohydrolase
MASIAGSSKAASLTTNPTEFFKIPNSGRIARGTDGDLVVLAADPDIDPRNFA